MWVPAWDAVQALPGDGASKSQVFPDWGDVQLCSCTLCCKMQFSQRCTALELSAPVQCRVECASAMQCIFGRLGTECILSHPMHSTASIRHCASAMYHNSMQCFAMFCNVLQHFAAFCNISQCRGLNAAQIIICQCAKGRILIIKLVKYKIQRYKYQIQDKTGQMRNPNFLRHGFCDSEFFIQIWWEAEWHILKLPKTFVAWKG